MDDTYIQHKRAFTWQSINDLTYVDTCANCAFKAFDSGTQLDYCALMAEESCVGVEAASLDLFNNASICIRFKDAEEEEQ